MSQTGDSWQNIIGLLYPDVLSRTYCVPPVHFNKVTYARNTVPDTNLSALVPPVSSTPPVHSVAPASQPSGSATPAHNVPPASQPSGNATPVHNVPPASRTPGSVAPVQTVSAATQPSGIATPVHKVPPASQPSGSAAPVHNVTPASQKSGSATPTHNVPPASRTPASATPTYNVPPASRTPASAAPVHGVPPVNQQQTSSPLWTPESEPLAKPASVLRSDFVDDFAQRHVLANLKELGNRGGEVMFIVSQLNFSSYLNKPSYAAEAAQLPRLITLPEKYRRGDFDILLIHRRYGVLIGEIKSVGRSQPKLGKTPAEDDADVAKRVGRAIKQLDKSEIVVKHVLDDIARGLTVRKTLFLPNVGNAQLRRVLGADPLLEQKVCRCLGASDAEEAWQLCCCSDQLSDPAAYWDVTPPVLSRLTAWWQHRMARTPDNTLTDNLYLNIVSRFVGPATSVTVHCTVPPRVEVRTEGEAVAELGRLLALLVLTQQQLDLMNRSPPRVCLTGPPGTGKTIMLVLQGLRWLLDGRNVHIVSSRHGAMAVSVVIQRQLQLTLENSGTRACPSPGNVLFHSYDFYSLDADVERAVSDLRAAAAEEGVLCVLMDEAVFHDSPIGIRHQRLVTELAGTVASDRLYLWTACISHKAAIPPTLQVEGLTTCLRSAPVIRREVEAGLHRFNNVHRYSDSDIPAPGDGLDVVRLQHHGDGHHGRWPVQCDRCGTEVAAELRRLGVGGEGAIIPGSPAPLRYSDVLVVTRSSDLQEQVRDDTGEVTSPASGVVRGLRAEGLPVCVLEWTDMRRDVQKWEDKLVDVALAGTDQVTVADYGAVSGLERPVVVWLPGRWRGDDDVRADDGIDAFDRLIGVSRGTTHLIVVDVSAER